MAVVKINAVEVAPERVESAEADSVGGETPAAQPLSLLEFEVVQEVVAARPGA